MITIILPTYTAEDIETGKQWVINISAVLLEKS